MKNNILHKFFPAIITLCFFINSSNAQTVLDSIFILPDSASVFTIENFYTLIRENHPVVKQVDLMSDVAKQEIRLARGNFDPKIEASLVKKNLKGIEYYNIFNSELKVPTIFPLDPKIGIEQNRGAFLNPERYISPLSDYRQLYAGISIPLGRGLITDERRTFLRQAELFSQTTEADQIRLVNKLLLEATKDYWQWFYSYYNYRLYERSVEIARDIFKRVKVNYEFGELAPIDTIQAKLTWQQRLIDRQEAWLEFQNSGIYLSNYLWDSLSNPVQLRLQWAPADEPGVKMMEATSLNELMQRSLENHPDLQIIRIRLQHLTLERNLAVENLKPRIDLNYNFINQPLSPEGDFRAPSGNDYKFGVDFSFPIFLRKERAKLAFTKLKLTNTRYQEDITILNIRNDIQLAYNTLVNNQQILQQQLEMADGYYRLLRAELINVENGESDLFRLNVQQERFIESQSKALKIKADLEKQKALLYWTAGVRNLSMN